MKTNKIIGSILIVLAILVVIGLVLKNLNFWYVVDTLMIVVCATSGVILLRQGE